MPNAFKYDFSDRVSSGSMTAVNRRRKRKKENRSGLSLLLLRLSNATAGLKLPSIPAPGIFPVVGASIGFIAIMLFVSSGGEEADAYVSAPQEEWVTATLETEENITRTRSTTIKRGDNSIAALERLGFDYATSHDLISKANSTYKLRNIRTGQTFTRVDNENSTSVYYNIDGEKRLQLRKQSGDKSWHATLSEREVYARKRFASGMIEGSLFVAADRAGIDQRTIMNLVDIFAWDIDFARDMRSGDTFQLVYEERYNDEGKMLESTILAAEFVNQGETYQAVRYEQANGKIDYFTPEGKSMRKAYLKAPVKFSRISSTFKKKRKHPVLGYTRAHRGVDYAARSGTPIRAIGDGRVTYVGWKGGYGRYIEIQHTNRNHTTAYAHMRSYARGLKKGMKIRQGKVIGYVGMSGLATGPHLHFEFRTRGRAVNPLTVKHPPAKPIARAEKRRFKVKTAPLLAKLEDTTIQVALNWE